MQNYEEIMKEVDRRMSAIDLTGYDIINHCQTMIIFLKEKLAEITAAVESKPFGDDADEITYFKHYKPMLQGRLIYFYKILRIEIGRPPCEDRTDEYYLKKQEELRLFFDRHIAFYQYYKSGGTHLDAYYFLRKSQEKQVNIHMSHFGHDMEFSTGYDILVARIIAMELLYSYLTVRKRAVQHSTCDGQLKMNGKYKWTGHTIELVEIVYGLVEMQSVNQGDVSIQELVSFVATSFGIEAKDCYSAYTDIKRRKSVSRTYYLDKMRERLNRRMEQDDEKDQKRK